MLMSASSDFIALCREQISLLTQGLGASLSVVYLTQEFVDTPTSEAQLIPVVVYPETAVFRQGEQLNRVIVNQQIQFGHVLALPNQRGKLLTASASSLSSEESESANTDQPHREDEDMFSGNHQIVLPLIYEGVMMGILVAGRDDRAWNEREEGEVQRIAKTLAIACILDQRRAWLQQQLHQQQILQAEQRDLLDNLLHQFRNPLTAIRTFGKLLFKRLRPTDANRDVATSIVRESDRLQELLQQFDQVIDLTDADLTPLPLPKSQVVEASVQKDAQPPLLLPGTGEDVTNCELKDLLIPLLISAQAIAQERNLELIAELPDHLPLVKANIKALREVLSNIIDNALKYTPAGGAIWIATGQKKANFQGIAISDTGPGIPPADLEHLGERYYRGVQAQTEIPGTGLGIAIAKQLIAQMQGEIEVFSPALDSKITSPQNPGTTFIIWLPEV
ncbi:GAF domain-containing sensor histidine kinase [Sphaerospermopsis aphanizomenoides BCCUSP55]|uniref:GAF domain-containing sensor histidine kinase n=1 Tax=Sphaerospermopsis aphanizomenoides TaxID=459663 RepID=UPI001907DAA4|nr:GAF domain-containing sensor histidine kinase [Sphaerospermopsis aphanizomenoides]MBK1989880.1 GAF domain-containing sensor histidine kinase [Sphaerospermopsis aphanizomenoides BCCUSP55]